MEVPDKVERKKLSSLYVRMMTKFLSRCTKHSEEECRSFVISMVKKRAVVPKVKAVVTKRPGFVEIIEMPMDELLHRIRDKIISPSGSMYYPPYIIEAITTKFIYTYTNRRSAVKKLQFKAKEAGNRLLEATYNAIQNAVKVVLNSLPGAFGYAGSLFFDKGAYNSVTSLGRCQTSNAFVGCEQFFMANIPLYNTEELYNLLTLIADLDVDRSKIRSTMNRHGLAWVTLDEVATYLESSVKHWKKRYSINDDTIAMALLRAASEEELQFIWYHSSLYNLMIAKNTDIFRPLLLKTFDYTGITTDKPNTKEQFWSYSGDMLVMAITILAPDIGSVPKDNIAEDAEHDRLRYLVIAMCERLTALFNDFDDIHKTFMRNDLRAQMIMTRSKMNRKSIVLSDTDSIMFSVARWSNWINQKDFIMDKSSYDISAFVTFWLLKFNADVMQKFSIDLGATGASTKILRMKNEFMYVVMLLFDVKKTYAALCAVQEGVVNKELEPDIKGSQIRGALSSKEASTYCNAYLVEKILKPSITGTVDYDAHIKEVIKFETTVHRSLLRRELRFVPNKSLRDAEQYKNPNITADFHRRAWDSVFGDIYDRIPGPGKYRMVPVLEGSINGDYLAWLTKKNRVAAERLTRFIESNQKEPSAFLLPPLMNKIPVELMPLLDIRKLTYANARPLHLVCKSLHVSIGLSEKTMLLSDMYLKHPLKEYVEIPKD